MAKISQYPVITTLTGQELVLMDTGPSPNNRQTVTATTGTLAQSIAQSIAGGIGVFTPTKSGVVPASGGGTATVLRADGTWSASFTGTWTFPTLNSTVGNIVTLNSTTVNATNLNAGALAISTIAASSQVTIGPNSVPAFDSTAGNIAYYARTAAEISASVTPVSFSYEPLDLRRYGQTGSSVPDSAALASALAVINGSGVISLPANYAGTNPATLPAGVTIIDYRVAGSFPTGNDLLGGGRWINVGGNPEGSQAGFHTQQWVTSPSTTTSAILGTNKVTGDLSAGGGAMASGTFELDTYGTLTGISGNIIQALTGQIAVRSLGQTLSLVTGVEGGGGIDRSSATTNINTWVSVQGDAVVNSSTAGATITNAYGGRFIQSTAPGITNNNFALSCEGDAMFRVGDHLRVENGSGIATVALTFTSNSLLTVPTGVGMTVDAFATHGASPATQPTGYGTPTGGALISSFAAGSITLPQLAAEVAQLIVDLKKYGLIV